MGKKNQKPPKTSSWFSRYQVKYKRRRQGKTDYRARLRLVRQEKNKFNTPKYRMIVRFTNKDIVCQIAYSTMTGDKIVCAAYAHELPKYGLKAGLTNYSAAYCTGLLLARRTLQKFSLDETYEGNTEDDKGEDYQVEAVEDGPRPFHAVLDVGLVRTSTGMRVFGALKGALDGGLDIPHSVKRFAGYSPEEKTLDAEMHQNYIIGGHVQEYMEMLQEDEPEKYQELFSKYVAEGVDPDGMEEMYTEVHEAIREDPSYEKKEREKPAEVTRWKQVKLTLEEKKANLKAKIMALKAAAEDDDDEDDE